MFSLLTTDITSISLRESLSESRYSCKIGESVSLFWVLEASVRIGELAIVVAIFCRFWSRFSVSKLMLISVPATPKKRANVIIKIS